VKTILYGHAWMSGALTAFAFFGYVQALNTMQGGWVWVTVVLVGLLWPVLGFSYVASRDWKDGGGGDSEDPAPGGGAGRTTEGAAGPSRPRFAPTRYLALLLMLVVFWAVAVLLVATAASRWPLTTG
jgi:hypothetical protein